MDRYSAADHDGITERKRLLGQRIQQRRAELELTQEDVAQLGGISSETVRQYEVGRGGDRPTARILESIDQALGWCLGSSKSTLHTGSEPVVDGVVPTPPQQRREELPPTTSQPSNRVSVDRDKLRQLFTLTSGLLTTVAQMDTPRELLDEISTLNQLAGDMTISAI